MKDLTQGSIVSHILSMAPPIVAGMVTIMICQLVDLYFVAGLGGAAVAGVAAAGNAGFLINGLMQVAAERELEVRLLDLRNSGDTSAERSRVVGYGAFALYARSG